MAPRRFLFSPFRLFSLPPSCTILMWTTLVSTTASSTDQRSVATSWWLRRHWCSRGASSSFANSPGNHGPFRRLPSRNPILNFGYACAELLGALFYVAFWSVHRAALFILAINRLVNPAPLATRSCYFFFSSFFSLISHSLQFSSIHIIMSVTMNKNMNMNMYIES